MDDDLADIGGAYPVPQQLDPAADKLARDTEFELFYRQEMNPLVAFLIVHGARPATAADLAQDAMHDAYRQWDAIDSPRAWIRVTAARKWWKQNTRDLRELPTDELPDAIHLVNADTESEIVTQQTLLAALELLPPRQRQVMAWTYDGYQPTEIGGLLGKAASTVRSLLRDARAALDKHFRGEV